MTTSSAAAFTFKSLLSLSGLWEAEAPLLKPKWVSRVLTHLWLAAHLPCQLSESRTLTTKW